jgi:hypothetical protein
MANAASQRRLFVRNEGGRENMVLNWHNAPEKEFRHYAKAFWNAAQDLISNGDMDSGPAGDFSGCPIVYLYRHALELYMKGILLGKGGALLNPRPTDKEIFDAKHSLKKLLPDIRRLFKRRGWDKRFGKESVLTLNDFEAVVNELEDVDGKFFSRYPVDKGGRGTVDHHFSFSVQKFARIMDDVLNTLDGTFDCLDAEAETLEAP